MWKLRLLRVTTVVLVASAAWVMSSGRRTGTVQPLIALAPVGAIPADVVADLMPEVREAFGREVVVAAPVRLPAGSYSAERNQHLATDLLDELARTRGDGSIELGVADVDLYVPDLNFVFGVADRERGVAVMSIARLRTADAPLFRRRASTEAIHELGHAFGLGHCRDPHCVMWFSNTLAESDRKGTRFCRAHAAALSAALGRETRHP